MRGLVGRARAGLATGQVPYGYRTTPIKDVRGEITGHEIVIDADATEIVRRIFTEYAGGHSMSTIVQRLNRAGVDSPRVRMRHQFTGWGATTLHAMLRNERYIGTWRFRRTEWVRVPGTNKRRPRERPGADVIVSQRPELAIIELPLWEAVQQRLKLNPSGTGKPRTRHLMSGFLVCAICDSPLTMEGSTPSNTYYRCATYKVKGTCGNAASMRAWPVRTELFTAMRAQVLGSELLKTELEQQRSHIEHLKPRIAEVERELQDTELGIKRIVACITGGDSFDCLRQAVEQLELTARSQRAQLQELRTELKQPLRRISAKDVGAAFEEVCSAQGEEAEHAKERLRRWLDGGLMRFDGRNVDIELSPRAIVADVSRRGRSSVIAPGGEKLTMRVLVEEHVPVPRSRAGGRPRRPIPTMAEVGIGVFKRLSGSPDKRDLS